MGRRGYLWFECVILFFIVPVLLYFIRSFLAFKVVPLVWCLALGCIIFLRKSGRFELPRLWRMAGFWRQTVEMTKLFLPLALILVLLAWWFLPLRFLAFPKSKPFFWGMLMVIYPILMAYPQEVVFRAFFFDRYQDLFPDEKGLLLANALSFGIYHSFYGNWLAPLLSACGGILFGWRYLRSNSVLLASLEHGLWGNFIFTFGYGWYFFSGHIH